jgi:hypothetical protein
MVVKVGCWETWQWNGFYLLFALVFIAIIVLCGELGLLIPIMNLGEVCSYFVGMSLLQNKFYVIEKLTGNIIPVKYISKKAFFLFHHINTYEENDQVCDILHKCNSR